MALLILTILSLFECVLAFHNRRLGKPPERIVQPSTYRVFVFGDSYGSFSPGYTMLQEMFDMHGADAIVKSSAYYGSTSNKWARRHNGSNMARAAGKQYGTDRIDFVWFTSGGNDLLEGDHLQCQRDATTWEAAVQCTLKEADKTRTLNKKLLENFFKLWPNAKVMQSSYDYPCYSTACMPFHKFDFCRPHWNVTCANTLGTLYMTAISEPLVEYFGADRYAFVSIAGASQVATGMPGASIGHPRVDEGSPCNMTRNCIHPQQHGAAGYKIIETFWEQYFSKLVMFDPNAIPVPHILPPESGWEFQHDLEAGDVYCNRNFYPDIEDENLEAPCNHTYQDDELNDHFVPEAVSS